MNLPNSIKSPVRRYQNNLKPSGFSFGRGLKKTFLGLSLSAFSFIGVAQTISIGSPVDGAEGSSDISFVVSLDSGAINNSGVPITGGIAYTGTATMTSDYVGQISFSIPDGAGSVQVVLSVIDDIDVECTETVTATVFGVSAGAILNTTATAEIIDDECGNFVISIGYPEDGAEASTDGAFTVYLEGGVINQTGIAITGTLDFSGGTAISGTDFTGMTIFSIPDGDSAVQVPVMVIDDLIPEGTETVTGVISGPSIGTINPNASTSTLNIIDNDSTLNVGENNLIELSIHPNPISSEFKLKSEVQLMSYVMLDMNGRVVSGDELKTKETTIRAAELSAGVYVLEVLLGNGKKITRKVIKK